MFQKVTRRPARNLCTLLLLALIVAGAVARATLSNSAVNATSTEVAIVLSSSTVEIDEGSTTSYTVALNGEPYADVTVQLSATTDTGVTADKYP